MKNLNENLIIKWQLSKIEIPIREINDMFLDPKYGREKKSAIRIGFPYGYGRVVIKTANNTYIMFTTNAASIMSKIVNA
ncbi:hypothetical protein C1T30_23815 [Bacillus sp. MBGLi97]|nr:hypothetical protein C1T30_23815 [Bacillus sp. MBGLi97]